jgi:hypothetical protein
MENTNQNPSELQSIVVPLPPKKWHNHKGLKSALILALIAGFVIWLYLSQPQDLKPVIIPIHKQTIQQQNSAPSQQAATGTPTSNINTGENQIFPDNSTTTPPVGQNSTSITSWSTVQNTAMGISVKYPTGWNVQSQNEIGMIITDIPSQSNSNAVSITYDESVLDISGGNPACIPTNDFQSGDFGPNILTKVVCKYGLKIVMGVGDRDPQAMDNKTVLQNMVYSITPITK